MNQISENSKKKKKNEQKKKKKKKKKKKILDLILVFLAQIFFASFTSTSS